MKSPAERLNSSGSSRLMVWPQFGIASAAEAMFCFIRMPGLRQGQSSSPCRMSVGMESRRISSTRSYSDGRSRCTPSWVFAEPTAECWREHGLELGEAARIFVLELHPGRTVSVFLSERFHAGGAQTRGYDFGLSAEALALLRGRAIAAAADAQRKRAVRVAKAKMQCRKSSHRQADDVGFLKAEMIEHRGDVVRSARLGVRACGLRDIRGRIAPRVKGDAAVALSEVAQLRLPAAMIPGELVHKDNCGTGAG